MRPLLLSALALSLAACGGDASPGDTSSADAADVDVVPCEALTPAMIAAALGIPEADVTLDSEAIAGAEQYTSLDASTFCAYDIADGHPYEAAMLTLAGHADADAAEAQFSSAYRSRTDKELAQIEAAGAEATEQMVADGTIDAEEAEDMDAGGTLAGLADSFSYLAVDGVGDQAVVEINGIMDPAVVTQAVVRDGSVFYTVSASPTYAYMTDAANGDAIREAHVALARQVAGQ